MAMARALSQNQKQLLLSRNLYRFFSRQPHTNKPKGENHKKKKTGLPTTGARCKSILGVNWRGQLNTLNPKLVDNQEREKASKTIGEFSHYIVHEKKLIVHVPEESQHCPNLLLDSRASLIIGHTDPSPLMQVFKQVKKIPPHLLLVGTLMVPDDSDNLSAESMEAIIKKELCELKQFVIQSSPSMGVILESGSHVLRTYVQSLNRMLESKKDDMFYRFDANSCHYVDMSGAKHSVECEMLRKTDKGLSPLLQVMIEGINRNQKRRMGLKVLCAWFLQVKVEDAFALSADKWGLDVLAKVVSDAERPVGGSHIKLMTGEEKCSGSSLASEWKDLRLTFREEMRDVSDFFVSLSRMERECVAAMGSFKERTSSPSLEQEFVEEE